MVVMIVCKRSDDDSLVSIIESRIVSVFGGFTRTDGTGAWTNDRGDIVQDVVSTYRVGILPDDWDSDETIGTAIVRVARFVRDTLGEDCVYVEIDRQAAVRFV